MKKILTFSILSAVAFNLTACKDDFLTTEPTAVVSTVPADVRLNGLYLMTYQRGTGGTTGQTDFGQKHVDICTDMLCSDGSVGCNLWALPKHSQFESNSTTQ